MPRFGQCARLYSITKNQAISRPDEFLGPIGAGLLRAQRVVQPGVQSKIPKIINEINVIWRKGCIYRQIYHNILILLNLGFSVQMAVTGVCTQLSTPARR
jgi:hypothetical protein